MDVSLLAIHFYLRKSASESCTMEQTNNPLWYFLKKDFKKIKPINNLSRKATDFRDTFTTNMQCRNIFIYSQMESDQFGGMEEVMYKRLKKTFLAIQLPLKGKERYDAFQEWKKLRNKWMMYDGD